MSEPLRHDSWTQAPIPSKREPKPPPRLESDMEKIARLSARCLVAEEAIRRIELLAFDARRRIDRENRDAA